jgi:hypothetical protein
MDEDLAASNLWIKNRWRNGGSATSDSKKDMTVGGPRFEDGHTEKRRLGSLRDSSNKDLIAGGMTEKRKKP